MREGWEYAGEEWKGDSLEAGTRTAWFRQRVRDILLGEMPALCDCDDVLADLLDWYTTWRNDFDSCRAVVEFMGDGYAHESWEVDKAAVLASLHEAIFEGCDAAFVVDFMTALPAAGDTSECLGADLLTERSAKDRFYDQRNRIHARWPRDCRKCRQEFRPHFRGAVHCRGCLGETSASRQKAPPPANRGKS